MANQRQERETTLKLTVMSFNVRNMHAHDGVNSWERRRELLYAVIRRYSPDILATQEAYAPQVAQLLEALPGYAVIGVGRDDGKTEGEYCALYYRSDRFQAETEGTFWLSETPDVPGSHHWTRFHPRICTWARLAAWEGTALAVYNVHLDHESQSAREKSIHLLQQTIREQSDPCPTLLVGDFNMIEENPAFLALQTSGALVLRDTFRLIHPEEREDGTYHSFLGVIDEGRIDYIFATPEFEVLDARILRDNDAGHYPSDHFPILALLQLDISRSHSDHEKRPAL